MTSADPPPRPAQPAQTAHAAAGARTPDKVVQGARAAALAGLVALIVLGMAWELWLAPTGRGTLALKILPLVFCLAGLLRHRLYTFRWLSLLVWLYLLEGTVRATTEHGLSQALAVVEVVLSLWLFACSALYIRWRLRHAAPEATVQSEVVP